MIREMKKIVAAPASAGKPVSYKGKTSSGHAVKFKVKRGRVQNLSAGLRVARIPKQGGRRRAIAGHGRPAAPDLGSLRADAEARSDMP